MRPAGCFAPQLLTGMMTSKSIRQSRYLLGGSLESDQNSERAKDG